MTGIGRGRGWLKLGKTDDTKIGLPVQKVSNSNDPICDNHPPNKINTKQSVMPQSHQEKLVNAIKQINERDDGISLNYKLKIVLNVFKEDCQTEQEAKDTLLYMHQKALEDESLIHNYIIFVSTNSFKELKLFQDDFRLLYVFINRMQEDYENAQHLRDNNKIMFHNAIRILNGYYTKINTHICAKPLLHYFNMLLDLGQPEDLELFANQIPSTGGRIFERNNELRKGMDDLLIKVRDIIITNNNLTQNLRLLLLLTLDMGINGFKGIPTDLLKFYQNKIEEKEVVNTQKSLSTLSIDTQPIAPIENFNSEVSVLLVDTSQNKPQVDSTPPPKPQPPSTHHNMFNKKSPKLNQDQPKEERYANWDNGNNGNHRRKSSGKPGRPILGAGARNYKKDGSFQDKFEENCSGWDVRQKNTEGSGWGNDKSHSRNGFREPRSNKGWEHDDRFDTDYS